MDNEMLKDAEIKKLFQYIYDELFVERYSIIKSIFLCGGSDGKEDTLRTKIHSVFTESLWHSLTYEIILPEKLFQVLLFKSDAPDLMTIEKYLADSVDIIIMCPESPGSFAELGAFSVNEKLRNKMICVNYEKYRQNKGFINKGPIKLIRNKTNRPIIYYNNDEKSLRRNILKQVSEMPNSRSNRKSQIPLFSLDNFLLLLIHLLQPVSKQTLIDFIKLAPRPQNINPNQIFDICINMIEYKYLLIENNKYLVSKKGNDYFWDFIVKPQSSIGIQIDNLRLDLINREYRNKKLKIG